VRAVERTARPATGIHSGESRDPTGRPRRLLDPPERHPVSQRRLTCCGTKLPHEASTRSFHTAQSSAPPPEEGPSSPKTVSTCILAEPATRPACHRRPAPRGLQSSLVEPRAPRALKIF
jgi:hypothetical protein